jgi:predicted amidohydrolase YtcJ
LPPAPPRTPQQQLEDRVADYKKLNEAGLTGIRHPGISIAEYRMLQEMQKRGQLTIRINALLRPAIGPTAVEPLIGNSDQQGEGDYGLRTAASSSRCRRRLRGRPDAVCMRNRGRERHVPRTVTIDTERYIAIVRDLNRGLARRHAVVGDAAIDLVLNAYEKANAERSIVDRRWSIEHAFIGRPDHLPRMKALGVAIAAQNHLYLAGPSLVKYWGAGRAGITTPVKMYLDAQLPVSSGTDAPVVPPALWTLYHSSRATPLAAAWGADQRITRQQVCACDGQQCVVDDEERTKGSIEPGVRDP